MVYLLRAFGHEPLVARDGEEGLEVARRGNVELVLLDLQLPKIDGYEVLRRLRSDPAWSAPVLAVTALAMAGDRQKVLAAGFSGYITKPIAPETFVADIERFLGHGPSLAAVGAVSAAPEQ